MKSRRKGLKKRSRPTVTQCKKRSRPAVYSIRSKKQSPLRVKDERSRSVLKKQRLITVGRYKRDSSPHSVISVLNSFKKMMIQTSGNIEPYKSVEECFGGGEDPITGQEFGDGETIVKLGSNGKYHCFSLETLGKWFRSSNYPYSNGTKTTNPVTREEVDKDIIEKVLQLTQAPQQPYTINRDYDREIILEVNGEVSTVFNEANNLEFEGQGVNVIRFGESFNQSIDKVKWPSGIEKIKLGNAFNQPLDKVNWPSSVRDIEFGDGFNQSIGKTGFFSRVKLPVNLYSIKFGKKFNQSIDSVIWPESLRLISFGDSFNKSIDKVNWPKRLDIVSFSRNYNHSVQSLKRNGIVKIIQVGNRVIYDRDEFEDSD